MFSQPCSSASLLNSLNVTLKSVIRKTIVLVPVTSAFVSFSIALATSKVSAVPLVQMRPHTTKTELLAQFPHHTSASSTLGFLVTNYSVYCQTNGSDTMDASTIKPLCGGVGEGEVVPQFKVDNTPIFLTTPLEPIVLFQNDKAVLLLGDL
ncbi:MAG: hypothetical protein DCF22_25180 [Leptolyngbya sp.]|nr:MAG: hypothetical protein DCF22_25180 [Leptolyngbya sp.]